MKTITNENSILESNDKEITLTSHRIRQEKKRFGKLEITSIMLEEVCSCEYNRKSKPLFLILGILLVALGFGFTAIYINRFDSAAIGMLSIVIGAVCIFIYWFTIKKALIISSSAAKIYMNTKGMKEDNIKGFIDKLEAAKSERLSSSYSHLSVKRAETIEN